MNTIDIYREFHSDKNKETLEVIRKWEQEESDTMLLENKPIHGVVPNGKPVFQFLDVSKRFHEGGTMVAHSRNCIAFIPAGFRKAPTYNSMNPVKYSLGGLSALMSLAHILVIPKNRRIYNALTLKRTDLRLVSEMEELGSIALLQLIRGPASMPGSIRWQLSQTGTIEDTEGNAHSLKIDTEDISESCQENFQLFIQGRLQELLDQSEASMKFSFHVGNQASIGYLHLHAYLGNLLTIAHDKMECKASEQGVRKNTPLDDVIYMMDTHGQ
uniref:Uncharacterized protein n=1 Tax=viral metagenome TaxID=1070528 RepID=A0A6C0F5E6_9ZZZZ|tara:strand:- start:7245 stop:8057 length:813 start_codon:yes stop_codon:yes gene_type:complete